MNTSIISASNFTDERIENHIANFESESLEFAKLQGQEDSEKHTLPTETLFNIKVKDPIRYKTQIAIDYIRNMLLPTSRVFDAAEIDKVGQKKISGINNEIYDNLQIYGTLKRKFESIVIDLSKRKYKKWLIVFAMIVGMGDASMAFSSFRYGGYSILGALFATIAIGAAISISHLWYIRWINKTKKQIYRVIRIAVVLLVSAIFFYWIGHLRAQASNDITNIALEGTEVSSINIPNLNGSAIAIVSFVLFVTVMCFSLILWQTKEERINEEHYNNLKIQISQVEYKIDALQKTKREIEHKIIVEKSEARRIFDYATSSIKRCRTIGQNAISIYKQTYSRYHEDVIPTFFSQHTDIIYDESFQFPKI